MFVFEVRHKQRFKKYVIHRLYVLYVIHNLHIFKR